jgi:hypothetical protein
VAIRKSSFSGIPFGNDANRPANPQVGQPYFNGESSRLELYTQATGWQNIVQETPAVVSVVGQLNETTPSTLTINGTNFAAGATAFVVGTNGVETVATTTTLISVVEISAVFPALSPTYEPYDVKVVNPSNLYGVLYEALGVNNSPIWSTTSGTLGTFTELQSFSVTVAATDTTDSTNSPLSYSVVSGALPGGLTLNSSTGVISGTPSNVIPNTTYSFTIAATDGRNTAVTREFSITITDRPPVWSTGTTLPTFTRNVAYSTTVVATDDDAISSYTLQSGSLPTGLSLNSSTGVISGTPSNGISTTFVIRVTDSGGNYTDRTFTIPNAGPVWSTGTTLPPFTKSSAYSTTVVATDDSGNNPTYSVASGSLPAGLTLSSAGVISGTPTSSTDASVTIRATDANGNTADRTFTMPNAGPTWSTAAGALTAAEISVSYSTTVVATDDSGIAPTYSIVSGSLPAGLSLASNTGVISGTPTTWSNGTPSSFTLRATDANGANTDRAFSIYVGQAVVQTFTSGSGSWTYPSNSVVSRGVQVLVVGAGGGGGDSGATGGGGGAGSFIEGTYSNLTPGSSYSYSVGAGSPARGDNVNDIGNTGGSSSFHTITALGGGGGGGHSCCGRNGGNPTVGGSGGGGSYTNANGASSSVGTVPSGFTGYANSGGNWGNFGGNWGTGGQGGGAGGAGTTGSSANGRTSTITGVSYEYSRGGQGGTGNGGNGVNNTNYGWGGGGIVDGNGGASGGGIIVLKYYA